MDSLLSKFGIKFLLLIFSLIWCAGIFVEFLVPYLNEAAYLLPVLSKSYSLVCHQDNCKLIICNGLATLVCARCTGLYIGGLLTSLFLFLLPLKKRLHINYLITVMILIVIDVSAVSAGIYYYSKYTAFITGFLLGSVGFFYLYYGLENFFDELKFKRRIN